MILNSGGKSRRMKAVAVAAAIIMAFPVVGFFRMSCMDIHAADLSSMENYPGVKHFNFASKDERSEVDEDCMIDPYYSIKMEKTMPDEYFGAKTATTNDTNTGEEVTGFKLGLISAKGQCGAICHNMFQYEGNWIDVKTTYMDWEVSSRLGAFFGGGFTRQRWKSVRWIEMKHEFFLAGTDTPVTIKGFQNYADVDDDQGIMLESEKVDDVWINYRDTALTYTEIPAGTDYTLASNAAFNAEKDMLYVQETSHLDIAEADDPGYDAEEAAKHCIGFTFSASEIYTCVVDNATSGFNILESGYYKFIPSATPQQGTPLIAKKVGDNDEEKGESNTVKPEEEWTYYINAFVPEETEEYNFYDSFRIEDQINENLDVGEICVLRGEEDVTDLFNISCDGNLVSAAAKDTGTNDFYGYDYVLEITVSLASDRETLEDGNLIDENCCFKVLNQAAAIYGTGKEDKEIPTNETETTIQFEKTGDIAITKEIKSSDVYGPHGEVSFIFNLKGTTSDGEEKEYNRCITFPEEYVESNTAGDGTVSRTVIFEKIPEGEYVCSEYATDRFETADITDIKCGTGNGSTVTFNVDGTDTCEATFVNEKKSWEDYSHSSLVINAVGGDR